MSSDSYYLGRDDGYKEGYADAKKEYQQKWIPFRIRPLTEEEQKEHPDWCFWLDCELPEDEQEVLVSSPDFGVYVDTFYNEGSAGCGFDGGEDIVDGMAWMPLPEPWKEGNNEVE